MISGVYASPITLEKKEALAEITFIGQDCDFPCIVVGDFDALISPKDKIGGRPRTSTQLSELGDAMEACGLSPLQTVGVDFSWNNNQEGACNIQEKIDHRLANTEWGDIFHDA